MHSFSLILKSRDLHVHRRWLWCGERGPPRDDIEGRVIGAVIRYKATAISHDLSKTRRACMGCIEYQMSYKSLDRICRGSKWVGDCATMFTILHPTSK